MPPFPKSDGRAAPEAALLFARIIFIRDVGSGIAPKGERPTVANQPAGDVLSADGARSQMAPVNVGTREVADPWSVVGEGLELFSGVNAALPVLAGGVDTDL